MARTPTKRNRKRKLTQQMSLLKPRKLPQTKEPMGSHRLSNKKVEVPSSEKVSPSKNVAPHPSELPPSCFTVTVHKKATFDVEALQKGIQMASVHNDNGSHKKALQQILSIQPKPSEYDQVPVQLIGRFHHVFAKISGECAVNAQASHRQRHLHSAISHASKAFNLLPNCFEYALTLGQLLFENKDPESLARVLAICEGTLKLTESEPIEGSMEEIVQKLMELELTTFVYVRAGVEAELGNN